MTDRAAFLRNIAEQRFSVLPRLVYADWLDEFGPDQPADAKRAELIRASQYLDESKDEHKPVMHCDCDRCRMARRVTELRDEGINNITDTSPGISLIVTKWVLSHGMPVAAKAHNTRSLPIYDNSVGLNVARLFLAWPLTALAVQFDEPGAEVRWQLDITVNPPPVEGRHGAAVRVRLTPELLEPATDGYTFASPRMWTSQDQWAVVKHRPAPTLAKVPDIIRKLVKRVAAERWSGRDDERRSVRDMATSTRHEGR